MEDLFDAACNAVVHGSNVQQTVRDMLADPEMSVDDRLHVVCHEMGKFKDWSEDAFVFGDKDKRKAVNNVINDVSRICRNTHNKSIRCIRRKGGHVYDAVDPAPKKTASTAGGATPIAGISRTEAGIAFVKANPYTALGVILKELTPEEFMQGVKTAQELDN